MLSVEIDNRMPLLDGRMRDDPDRRPSDGLAESSVYQIVAGSFMAVVKKPIEIKDFTGCRSWRGSCPHEVLDLHQEMPSALRRAASPSERIGRCGDLPLVPATFAASPWYAGRPTHLPAELAVKQGTHIGAIDGWKSGSRLRVVHDDRLEGTARAHSRDPARFMRQPESRP